MPAAFKIVGDALQRLMQFAQHFAIRVRWLRLALAHVARHEAIDAAQKAVGAVGAGVGPIHFFFGRGGEQLEDAAGIGAEAFYHLVGAHHVALRFRHLRAVFDHHALR